MALGGMMDAAEILGELSQIFYDVFDDDSLSITRELSAADVDGWDSLTHLRLILSVERAFKVKFSAAETGRLKNVGELADLIASKMLASNR